MLNQRVLLCRQSITLELASQAWEIAQNLGLSDGRADVADTLGQVLQKMGEFERAEKISRIGHRNRWHRFALAKPDQVGNLDRPFGQRIGRVDMQMNEVGVSHGLAGFHIAANMSFGTDTEHTT